jgi:type II secretory pathway component PulJ
MIRLLKLLLTYQFKNSKSRQKNGGFTLIELLVGLVLAFLVILPLLGFVVNIMNTDRREQAKATSEQEIQAALNYIARDAEQAVYIYDATGIQEIRGSLDAALPAGTTAQPVLVFWKRQFVPESIPVGTNEKDDAFVYSLVAYFLKQPDPNCASSPWSCTNQIIRFQTSDVVRDTQSANPTPYPGQIVDNGFQSFVNVTVSGTPPGDSPLEQKMNSWTKAGGSFKNQPDVLIDYIDRSPASRANRLRVDCPPEPNPRDRGPDNRPIRTWEGVPAQASNPNYSFYACVDPKRTTAKVFIRGNALARINTKTATPPTYLESQAAYFPRSSIQVKGRGLFSQDP